MRYCLVLLLLTATAWSQSTVVTATLQDAQGNLCQNAPVTINFINPSPYIANWNGFPMQATTWSSDADSTAFIKMQVPDLNFIAPATGTHYSINVCNNTSNNSGQPHLPCVVFSTPACPATGCFTGTTIDFSSQFTAAAASVPNMCAVQTGGGSGVNPGTPYQVTRYDPTGKNIQDSTGSDNPANGPTRWVQGLSVQANANYHTFVNSPNGTTANLLICPDPTVTSMEQVTTCPVSTTKAVAIADLNGAGVTGNVQGAVLSQHACVFDNQTVVGDYVIPSASVAGDCSDSATRPAGAQGVGRVATLNSGGGTLATVEVGPWDLFAPGGGGNPVSVETCAQVGGIAAFIATNILGCDTNATTDFAGHFLMKSLGLTDTSQSGFLFQTKGPALPTLAAANSFYMAAGTSFGTTWGMEPANSIPTSGNCAQWATGDTTGWRFLSDSGAPCSSTTIIHGIAFTIYTGSALTSGTTIASVDYVTVPFGCTITAYNLLIDTGTITVKFWKVATGTAIPTSGNSISTSGIGISSGTAIHSTTLSDFTTTTITANDIMAMDITAVAGGANYVNGVLVCQ